jgi:broad specificity phosphatase PhoE
VSPALCAGETAAALGLDARIEPALSGCDYGSWRGQLLADVGAEDPDAVALWLADPAAAPHGGESVNDVIARVAGWMAAQAGTGRRIVAVTHAEIVKAAVVTALQAPPQAFWRVDVAPLAGVVLHERQGSWTLRLTGSR